MSTRNDVDALVSFLQRTFVDQGVGRAMALVAKQEHSLEGMEQDRKSQTTLISVA